MSQCPLRLISSSARQDGGDPPHRFFGLALGIAAFATTWIFFTCLVLFLGNLPRKSATWLLVTADAGDPVVTSFLAAGSINLGLVLLFGIQHSGMARPAFKAWLTRRLPPALERSVYVLAACAAGFLLIFLWQPIPVVVWSIEQPVLRALMWIGFASGWLILLLAAISIDMGELLGLKQSWSYFGTRAIPRLELKTRGLYRWLSHPMYVGVLLGFWSAPHMTVGHLLLAGGMTLYIAIGMTFEERDLALRHGRHYHAWRESASAQPTSASVTHAHVSHLGAALRSVYAPVYVRRPSIERRLSALAG